MSTKQKSMFITPLFVIVGQMVRSSSWYPEVRYVRVSKLAHTQQKHDKQPEQHQAMHTIRFVLQVKDKIGYRAFTNPKT